ncbi:hypothetical protein TH61_10610 [Rufibacter sp. DG15C]|uniref:M56 family metallopeptidase n=1 Tax=Rufibacter sp. DG15C TaxID=1379909 RepID=UPI00078BA4F1|nr:M56 family metallopeptidase [Rufibacter sp. DG15C]AMM51534.1 hypothetical protein TH61_10610 [Rufibacter sp. DG15C]
MPALLLYLLQVNIGIALLYLTYQLLLRPTTFYQLNRWFLAGGLVLANVLPLLDFSSLFIKNEQVFQTLATFSGTWTFPATTASEETAFDYWQIPVYLFWLGVGVMAIRLLVQMASLYRLHRKSRRAAFQGIPYRQLPVAFPPFSFANTIYFNPNLHPQRDWLPILQHEHTHVTQWHTLDILLVELTCLFHWFNPAVWLLRISLKQNLEFLTDQQTLEAGIDRKQYQFSLLQTAGAPPIAFTSSFNYHSLKHRIMMMNKAPSTRVQQARFLVAIPALALSLFSLQGMAQTSPVSILEQTTQDGQKIISQQDDYDVFKRRNPTVDKLGWNQENLYVHLKSGKTEVYPRTAKGLAEAEKKYGTLPSPPPPPPPAPAAPNAPDAALAPPPPPPAMNVDLPADFKKRNPTVKGISASEDTFYVVFKNGEVESFDATAEGRAAFEKKYGALPPPPPPTRIEVNEMAPPPPPKVKKKNLPPSPPNVIVDEMAPPPPKRKNK